MAKGKPKKRKVVTGLDIGNLSKARPTKIPHVETKAELEKKDGLAFKVVGVHLCILIAIVLITYSNSLFGQFLFNDDYIQNVIRGRIGDDTFWLQMCLRFIAAPLSQSWLLLSLALDFHSFGLEALWYHVVNVVLHIASCIYFYILVLMLTRRRRREENIQQVVYDVPLIAAGLLACHPLGAETVAYITARSGTLVASNFFLALIFFLVAFFAESIKRMVIGYTISIICCFMAIWSGLESIVIPAAALVLICLLCPRSITFKDWSAENWPEMVLVGFFAVAAALLPCLGVGVDFANTLAVPTLSLPLYIATQLRALVVYYLRCFIVPAGLSIAPIFLPSTSWLDPVSFLGLAILIGAIWAAYKLRHNLLPAFGLSLFVLGYLPSAAVIQSEITADRRFYISLAGLALVAAWYLAKYAMHSTVWKRVALVALFIALSGLTIWRNFAWSSDLSLWQATKKTNPQNAAVKAKWAKALLNSGKPDEAKKEAEAAIKLNNENVVAHVVLGDLNLNQTHYAEADAEFSTALGLAQKEHITGWFTRDAEIGAATACLNLKQYANARDRTMNLLLRDRNDVDANLIMAKSLIGMGQAKYALNFLNTGFKVDQSNSAYLEPIADASLAEGSLKYARNAYGAARAAMSVAPSDNVRRIYAQAALEIGRYKESEEVIDSLLKQYPDNAEYLYIKSWVEKQLGRTAQAEALRKQALQKDAKIAEKTQIKIFEQPKAKAPEAPAQKSQENDSVSIFDKP